MAKLSTHVLDTANGIPAKNMRLELYAFDNAERNAIFTALTDTSGRKELLADEKMQSGIYEICFFVAEYFQRMGNNTTPMPFLSTVPIRFAIAEENTNYHVPLLVSPWAYSTYRGS
ncbi:MAG: 5-hydroxyisourate hydrolase [Candidatus Tokpelaia sp. JSC085]|nr:MAG: 5-hydroxyisourate hydrolase [Candidatus Tokpelaia sp. JSC085]